MTQNQLELVLEHFPNATDYNEEGEGCYSPRNAYGETTHAVVYEDDQQLFQDIGDFMRDSHHWDKDEVNEIADAVSKMKTDSLGMNIIVY